MDGLDYYKEFVDKCVDLLHKEYGGCINARMMREKRRKNEGSLSAKYNAFLDILNDEQLELLADLLDDTHSSAIHDFLAMLEEEMCQNDLRLVKMALSFLLTRLIRKSIMTGYAEEKATNGRNLNWINA